MIEAEYDSEGDFYYYPDADSPEDDFEYPEGYDYQIYQEYVEQYESLNEENLENVYDDVYDVVDVDYVSGAMSNIERVQDEMMEKVERLEERLAEAERMNGVYRENVLKVEKENDGLKEMLCERNSVIEDLRYELSREISLKEKEGKRLRHAVMEKNILEGEIVGLDLKVSRGREIVELLDEVNIENTKLKLNNSRLVYEKESVEDEKRRVEGKSSSISRRDFSEIQRLKRANNRLVEKVQNEVMAERERALKAIDKLKHDSRLQYATLKAELKDTQNNYKMSTLSTSRLESKLSASQEKVSQLRNVEIKHSKTIEMLQSQVKTLRDKLRLTHKERDQALTQVFQKTKELETLLESSQKTNSSVEESSSDHSNKPSTRHQEPHPSNPPLHNPPTSFTTE